MLHLLYALALLLLLCGACAILGEKSGLSPALLPLPVLSGAVVVLYLCGIAGILRAGAVLVLLALAAVWVLGLVQLRPAGVLHCFSGSGETAREYLNMGFYLSFAGPVTFKNAARLQEVARFVPDDRFLIETDSPYLAPVPMRGRRNEPTYVQYVAGKLAELRNKPPEEIAQTATENTCRLYGIAL